MIKREQSILPLSKREAVQDEWLHTRLNDVLKESMQESEIHTWLTISKEYNEDPLTATFTPSKHDDTRRIGMCLFHLDDQQQLHRYWIGLPIPTIDQYYTCVWDRQKQTEWECLNDLLNQLDPEHIAINRSKHVPVSDGLSASLYDVLLENIDSRFHDKFISSEKASVHWFLKRSKEEMTVYPYLTDLTTEICRTALSNEVIVPGVTTCEDVVDWLRQKVMDLGLKTSFYPTIDVQRKGAPVDRLSGTVIKNGDIVHIDFGITYLGISTDMQQLGYVLYPNETDAPDGLKNLLEQGMTFASIALNEFVVGETGNDIFERAIEVAKAQELQPMLYSHPIGYHCHEAGPTIGLYDRQERIPQRGDYKIINDSAYALEFNVKGYVPEWEQETYVYLEQPIAVADGQAYYLSPMQENFYLIR
ncbi:M24 family metallopeptidase [Allobacillus halotolerans]|uniref:Aminopeptidase P family protein n=1 Tax=Allobacillus halotolerans TaxID=570278 RepID=A0ABS6GSA3_9BACI|nr:M24 family metallopeptidase [Allobacillus halotolerans]MBU6081990.1 aminopeptidase P family protein [Allobacillus halotolerans]